MTRVFRTFRPIHDQRDILEKLEEVAVELAGDMETSGWAGKTVTLKYKLDTYQGLFLLSDAKMQLNAPSIHSC